MGPDAQGLPEALDVATPAIANREPASSSTGSGKVMRGEWRDPTDITPSATRTVKTISGYRRFRPLRSRRWRDGEFSNVSEKASWPLIGCGRSPTRQPTGSLASGICGCASRAISDQRRTQPGGVEAGVASYGSTATQLFDAEQRDSYRCSAAETCSVAAWRREVRRNGRRGTKDRAGAGGAPGTCW